MEEQKKDGIRQEVRKRYTDIAKSDFASCCVSSYCCTLQDPSIKDLSAQIGYNPQELDSVPDGANMGLGCGNPLTIADLKPGETVLDLGSGAGFDAFLAAKSVGKRGKVIGVDMTPEMIKKAKKNADKMGVDNVEFRLGEIEELPVPDNSVDVALSNCVINLSPDKRAVFGELFRVLKPGGRISISDVLRSGEIPGKIMDDPKAYTG